MSTTAVPAPRRGRSVSSQARRRIIELRQSDHSLSAIARHLNGRGFKTALGGRWATRTVRRVLEREGLYRAQPGGSIPAEAAELIFALHAEGKGPKAIARALDTRGVEPLRADGWSRTTIRNLLIRRGLIVPTVSRPDAERFAASLRRTAKGCDLWKGPRHPDGYGLFAVGGNVIPAHRAAFEMATGRPLPQGSRLVRACPNGEQFCVSHWRIEGSLAAEFWARTREDPATGCLLWTGRIDANSYGRFDRGGETRFAHRVAYDLRHGPLVVGEVEELHHRCRTRACVKPAHLLTVTRATHPAIEREEAAIIAGIESGQLASEVQAAQSDAVELSDEALRRLSRAQLLTAAKVA